VRVNHASPEGLAVDLRFQMRSKNDFHFMVFLAANGVAEVSGEELLKTFDEERTAFLMDYVDPRTNFAGRITPRVLEPKDLENALKAFKMYRRHLIYPDNYEYKLTRAAGRAQNVGECPVELVVA